MKILFIPYSVLQAKLHAMLADALTARGHETQTVNTSGYAWYRTEHEKEAHYKLVRNAAYKLNMQFNSSIPRVFQIKQAISKLLSQSRPDCVVVGLDSGPEQRAVINICRRFNIPTILIQDGAWIFTHLPTPIPTSFREFASDIVCGRFKKIIKQVFTQAMLGDTRNCRFGCGGCDKVAVFSNNVHKRLLAARVPEHSIVITGCLASYLENKNNSEIFRSYNNQIPCRLVVISQPLSEVNEDLELRVFAETALALNELSRLGWDVAIRLHPRETKFSWSKALQHLEHASKIEVSHDINWRQGGVLLGFVSTLLPDIVRHRLPLLVYNLNSPEFNQEDFFEIDGVPVCSGYKCIIEKAIHARFTSPETLEFAVKKVTEVFGLWNDVLERNLAAIEYITLN